VSHRRAWELVEELNAIFGKPVVERQIGGEQGGGAKSTALGLTLISRRRAVEKAAAEVAKAHLAALQVEVDRPVDEATSDPTQFDEALDTSAGLAR
jgi:molybdate transport system regulatory protein